MQAVILAAGRGTRMGELTKEIPKPLLKISGQPILEYTMINLPDVIDRVIFVIGYQGEKIKKYFGNERPGRKISYREQKKLNGTGGAIFDIQDALDERFMVLYGDDLYHKKDLEKLLSYDLALLAKKIENNTRFGAVEVDENGYLKNVVEFKDLRRQNKAGGALVNMGAYMLTRDIFKYPPAPISATEFGLPQTLAQMADKYKIKVIEADIWHPNGNEEDLRKGEEAVRRYFKI